VASVLGAKGASTEDAWITGVAPGTTTVTARTVFADGRTQDAQPASVRVVPSPGPPAGSTVIARGGVPIDAPTPPPGTVSEISRYVPSETRAAGQADITVDWVSPTDRVPEPLHRLVGFAPWLRVVRGR